MSEKKWIKTAAVTITVSGIAFALYLFFDFLFAIFLPFVLAFLLAAITHPIAERFAARLKLSKRAVAAAFTLLALALLFSLIYLLFSRALIELQNFISYLMNEGNVSGEKMALLSARIKALFSRSPIEFSGAFSWLSHFIEDPERFFSEQARGWLTRISERIPEVAMRFARALPSALLFLLVTIIACFYFSVEYETITGSIYKVLPYSWGQKIPRIAAKVRVAAAQYLRAYCLLFAITFGELLLGLLFLRVRYVFLLAMLIALLDFLPIFGVGTALIPWALFSLFMGNTAQGIGLVVLYAIITVIRQIIEPHIVGKSLGLHPVLMLISLYAGLKIFGVIGVFAGPALALGVKVLLKREEIQVAEKESD
ncbi:MAG: sporulation integral membrane protein YtvI [Clostridia bacterium]|nr:sporulation integral membrane protein YtvI [Clostridia bacterium]